MNATASVLNSTVSNDSYNAMSFEDIRKIAPRVFFTEPTNPMLSKHYVFASTEAVIKDMATLGWDVVNAAQPHPRRKNSCNSYHMVTFRNNTKIVRTLSDGTEDVYYPQIVLTNSHDGFSCFCFYVSLYRVATGVSIIIAPSDFDSINIKHIGYSFDELRNVVATVVNDVPNQIEIMNTMKDRELDETEKRALALAAVRARKNDPNLIIPDVLLDDIVNAEDDIDSASDLWTVFNNIMRKMLEGDYKINGKRGIRKARRITGIAKTISLGQAIFKEAANLI